MRDHFPLAATSPNATFGINFLIFNTLRTLLNFDFVISPLDSVDCELLCENTPGWGIPPLSQPLPNWESPQLRPFPAPGPSPAHRQSNPCYNRSMAGFGGVDFIDFDSQLNDEEKLVRQTA